MKGKRLDERQERITAQIGEVSFFVMFCAGVLVILAQLIWKGSLELVMGETIVLTAGGIVSLAGYLKNGIWTRSGRLMGFRRILLESVVCSGIFSVLYGWTLSRKAGESVGIARYVAVFFIGIFLLCSVVLLILEKAAHNKRKEQESKYSE